MGKSDLVSCSMKHLFDMDLQYSSNAVECVPAGMKEGRIIGSGHGTVKGSRIRGSIQWSNYENTVRQGLCKLQIPRIIRTDDGAEIKFEARGMALVTDKSRPTKWNASGVLHFQTDDNIENSRYAWLNNSPAIYEGEFDIKTAHAVYRAYTKD
jgi:hypothetical protein